MQAVASFKRWLFRLHGPEPAPIVALARGLRERFDPRGILNPGLMA